MYPTSDQYQSAATEYPSFHSPFYIKPASPEAAMHYEQIYLPTSQPNMSTGLNLSDWPQGCTCREPASCVHSQWYAKIPRQPLDLPSIDERARVFGPALPLPAAPCVQKKQITINKDNVTQRTLVFILLVVFSIIFACMTRRSFMGGPSSPLVYPAAYTRV